MFHDQMIKVTYCTLSMNSEVFLIAFTVVKYLSIAD